MLPPVVSFKKILRESYANDIPKCFRRNSRGRIEKLPTYSPV